MKKRIITIVLSGLILAMNSMTVFAASPTVGTTEKAVKTQKAMTSVLEAETPAVYAEVTTVSDGFVLEEVSDTMAQAAVVAVQNEVLYDISKIGKMIGNKDLSDAATNPSKKVETSIVSIVDVDVSNAKKDENGSYVVTLNIPDIVADDAIVILHYTGKEWEAIEPSKVENGKVTFLTESFSPFCVVELSITDVEISPKTGEGISMLVVIMFIAMAGVVVCTKKYYA